MKKYTLIIIILILSYKNAECGFVPSINYKYYDNTNSLLLSFDLKSRFSLGEYGVFDEFTVLKLSAGEKLEKDKFSFIYDLGLFSYLSLIKIPLIKNKHFDYNNHGQLYDLGNDYTTFLTFSYQGLSFTNSGIYKKDYNWFSLGVDILYKKFKPKNHFYSKLSFIASANTLENNRNYFKDIDSSYKSEFCLSSKLSSLSKLMLKDLSTLRLEAYYRNFYNYLNQKEAGITFGYENMIIPGFILNSQIGYTIYGANNKWKNFGSFNVGLSYLIPW